MTAFSEYDRYDALGLAELVRSGQVTSLELLEEAIVRTEQINPRLNAIITPMYDLARRAALEPRSGPFAGVPFLLKDLVQAYAGVRLAFGSAAMEEYVPDRDSHVVAAFRRAGLVVFGKTNVPELGLVAVTESKRFGPARNPWDPERSPGGSSGGSAAAVAAGIVPMASGNDGGGSIRIPAAWCGLFGMKPSRGRVSVGPYHSEVWEGAVADHVITRSVRDSAAVLDATIGGMAGDPIRYAIPERPFLDEVGTAPGRLRIAFTTRSPIGSPVDPECAIAVERTARLLEDLGHHVEEREAPVDGFAVMRAYLNLYLAHVAADLRWIASELGDTAARRVEPITRLAGLLGETLSAAEFTESRRTWNGFARSMGTFHETWHLYLTPTTAALPVRIGSLQPSLVERLGIALVNATGVGGLMRKSGLPEKLTLEQLAPVPFTQLANLTGQPAMTLPMHWTESGLPCGVQLMAAVGGEGLLFRLAGQLEEARPWAAMRPPQFSQPSFPPSSAEIGAVR